MIRATKGAVTMTEEEDSKEVPLDGIVRPRPLRRGGKASSRLSTSLMLSRPVKAGMK